MQVTPVNARRYTLAASAPLTAKGKQRQIVLDILRAAEKPMTPEEIAPIATSKGLTAVGGVLPSVRYHLHHLVLLGHATWEAAPAVAA